MLAALLALQLLPAAGTLAWEPTAASESGRYAIAPATVRRDGDDVEVLVRMVLERPLPNGISSAVTRYVFHCRDSRATRGEMDFYRGDAFFNSEVRTPAELTPIPLPPGSSLERIGLRVCARQRQ